MTTRVHGRSAWLSLFRIPNFLTVPGDILAGWLLVTGGMVPAPGGAAAVVAAGLCLYGAGLLFNDWADLEEDRRDRPARPLPSGAVTTGTVAAVATGLVLAASLMALASGPVAFLTALALAACILVYTFLAKRHRFAAAVTMGLCRGLNLLLGAAGALAAMPEPTLPPAAGTACLVLVLYIAAVTWIAHRETRGGYLPWEGWLPAAVSALGLAAILSVAPPQNAWQGTAFFAAWSASLGTAAWTAVRFTRSFREPVSGVPPLIGKWIGALIPLQAALIIASGATATAAITAGAVFCLWPLQRRLAKWFYSS